MYIFHWFYFYNSWNFYFDLSFYHKIKCTESTTAKVIGFEKRWSRGSKGRMGRYIYYPVFSYKANGEEIEVEHNVSPTDFQVGEYVKIKYNSKNPYNII